MAISKSYERKSERHKTICGRNMSNIYEYISADDDLIRYSYKSASRPRIVGTINQNNKM